MLALNAFHAHTSCNQHITRANAPQLLRSECVPLPPPAVLMLEALITYCLLGAGIICMFSSTYNGEYEDVKAVHDGVGEPLHEQRSLA